ncbi:MAG: hypothetical protein L3J52_05860, partial [Proteobacteria bacterium]|nr:hypothetical protein [Pseudomonadota bacterium]
FRNRLIMTVYQKIYRSYTRLFLKNRDLQSIKHLGIKSFSQAVIVQYPKIKPSVNLFTSSYLLLRFGRDRRDQPQKIAHLKKLLLKIKMQLESLQV